MKKIKGLFRLLRFELSFSAGICVVMGQLLALGKFASAQEIISGFLSVFFISASILVLNDYIDVETDKINAPNRPIPSNLVTPLEALLLSIGLMVIGLVLSYFINGITLFCSVILLIIGILYNWKFKKDGFLGNIMVSFSVGMTFIYGGVSVGLAFYKIVWFFALLVSLIDLGEEIASDAMDVKGDAVINSNSLAIKYGKQAALKISGYIFLFVILLTIVPFIIYWLPVIYFAPFIIMDFVIAYSTIRLLRSAGEEGRKYIRWIYLGGLLGMLIFILLRLISA
jgi:geranylgeranylglycerol-phosphate geranylgeranyltransferase